MAKIDASEAFTIPVQMMNAINLILVMIFACFMKCKSNNQTHKKKVKLSKEEKPIWFFSDLNMYIHKKIMMS